MKKMRRLHHIFSERKRYATLLKRTYKGTELYDIREFYDANGEMKPGRKGISLREDQWKILVAEAQSVNEVLKPSENNATAPPCFKKNASGEPYLELSKHSSSHCSRVER